MPNRMNFTMKSIAKLEHDPGRRVVYSDPRTPGLRLHVRASGAKYFYFQKRVNGQPVQISLGRFPELTLKEAKKKAAKHAGAIAKGINPQAAIRALRGETTLGRLFDEFMQQHIQPYRKPKTAILYESLYRTNLSCWSNRRLSEISRRGVQALHRKLGMSSGPYSANRTLALLRSMFTKAISWGLFEGQNPAAGVERFPERSRERFLQAGEVPALFMALREEPNETARDCLWICLMTAARRGDVQSMRWADLDLDAALWRIPVTKSGKSQDVVLAPQAIELLREREARKGLSSWVFPSHGKSGHIVELKTAWSRVIKQADISDLRIHDLRRTFGSYMASLGYSLPMIGKALGHTSPDATAVYSRLANEPIREAAKQVNERLFELARKTEGSEKVVPIVKEAGGNGQS